MTINPEQVEGQPNPEGAGNEAASGNTEAPETPAGPFKQFETKEEYEAHFGTRAVEARDSLARKYGYKTVQEMDAAMADYKNRTDAEKSDLEKAQSELERLQPLETENLTLKQERAADRALLSADVDPKKLDDVMVLLKAKGIPLTDANEVDAQALGQRVDALLETHPYFKAGAKPASIGTGAPANGNANRQSEPNPWKKETRNLTRQAAITAENPQLAGRMRKAAGLQ